MLPPLAFASYDDPCFRQPACSNVMNTGHRISSASSRRLGYKKACLQIIGLSRLPFRRYSTPVVNDDRPFRMAVLGSGPAGFYTAYQVMANIENAVVDMYESLPVPFGLVRFGVAPDHPEVKVYV